MGKERWVEETFHPHWNVRLQADRVLLDAKTRHRHLVIFENATWGTVLMLDGVCQLTTADAFIRHEMMAHVPLMALDRPRHVLVIGGGDGGVLRQVLRHPGVIRATLCEIDRTVIDTALKYLPEVSAGAFDDARSDIVVADGMKFMAETRDKFDAILVDTSQPIGPSAAWHSRGCIEHCRAVLKDGGVLVTQAGLPFIEPDQLATSTQALAGLFKRCAPYLCTQASCFGGPLALMWASDNVEMLHIPEKKLAKRVANRGLGDLRCWTPAVHRAAFALPAYVQTVVDDAVERGRKAAAKAKAKKAR